MHIVCKSLPGIFKDVFGPRKAAFEERLLNGRNNCRRKNAVMDTACNVNWNHPHAHDLKSGPPVCEQSWVGPL